MKKTADLGAFSSVEQQEERNVALRLSYDGTAYCGWQRQKNLPTVQETIESAIAAVTGSRSHLVGCGRTDAGVHALTYVANFKTRSTIPTEKFPFAVNSHLPPDVSIMSAFDVSDDFHATFSARRKEYTYKIYQQRIHNPFYVNRIYQTHTKLDIKRMQDAARMLVGEHDFASFRAVGSNVKTSVRHMYEAEVTEIGDIVQIRLSANGFLYNMARSIAGTLLYVGQGKLEAGIIEQLFKHLSRSAAGPTLPPYALYMTAVSYDMAI